MSNEVWLKPVEFYFSANDAEKIFVKAWPLRRSSTRAIIQIAHGLGETADYYSEFSQLANQAGFAVFILEARGQGRTAGDITSPTYWEKAGNIGVGGFSQLRDDQYTLTRLLKDEYGAVPVFLLGHSMGATVARLYSFEYGAAIHGLILTGASSVSSKTDELLRIVEVEIAENGLQAPSKTTFDAMFSKLNTPFEPVTTPLDWITSDREMIEESLASPYSYISFNNQFYRDSFLALKEADSSANLTHVPKNLPIYLLSGKHDVITAGGNYTVDQAQRYRQAGIADVKCQLYENLRHSILRETSRAEVTKDILDWIENYIY